MKQNKLSKRIKKHAPKLHKAWSQWKKANQGKSLWKRYLPLPTLALVVIFAVACGKMDSASISSGTASVSGASVVAASAAQAPAPIAFSAWCEKAGGMLEPSKNLCELELKRMYGHTYNVLQDQQWLDTGLKVEPNDTVLVEVAGNPKMKIGDDVSERSASGRYIARTAGTVAFTSRNMTSGFGVRQVTVRRCYAATGETPRCP